MAEHRPGNRDKRRVLRGFKQRSADMYQVTGKPIGDIRCRRGKSAVLPVMHKKCPERHRQLKQG